MERRITMTREELVESIKQHLKKYPENKHNKSAHTLLRDIVDELEKHLPIEKKVE